jgi:hypothetical protein
MPDLATMLTNPETGPGNVAQAEAMRKILHAALFAGALGVGGRTLQGVGDFFGRNLGDPPKVPLRQSTIPVPVPIDLNSRPRSRTKRADVLAPPAEFHKEPLTWTAQHLANRLGTMRAPGTPESTTHRLLSGWGAQSPADMPWVYPAGAAAVGAGLYGGYKLTDWLLDKTRKREIDSELEQARKEYQEAMLGQYAGQKTAAVDPIDQLFEKQAILGKALGLGLLGMGAVGLASGLGSYSWARKHSRSKALEEAIRRRQEALFAQAPRPIMAIPVPQQVGQPFVMPGEEDAEEGLPKAAALAQAADSVLQRFQRQKQEAAQHWQMLINGPPKGGERAAKPQEPLPPQLPTLAGLYLRQPPPAA